MKHFIFSSTLVWLTVLLFLGSSHAYAQQNIREWVDQADVVCVASVVSLQEVKDGTPPFASQLPVTTLLATLRLQASLKGNATIVELPLEVYRFDMEAIRQKHPNGFGITGAMPYSDLEVGKIYLIFAKRRKDNGRFFLVNYSSSYASAIEIDSLSKAVSKGAGTLTNILQQLISALSSEDHDLQIRTLNLVETFGDVLWDKPPDWNPEYVNLIKKAPDNATLKILVQSHIIPLVLNLTKSEDTKIHASALATAAGLQVAEVIPQLVEMVKSESENSGLAANALANYRVFSAVPQLVTLLKNPDISVRKSAMKSLQEIRDKRSVPYIIEALTETRDNMDVEYLYSAAKTLYYITEKKPIVAYQLFQGNKDIREAFISFWEQWAAEHQHELKYLRSEMSG